MKTNRFFPILFVALLFAAACETDRPVEEDPIVDDPVVTDEPRRAEMRDGVQVVEVITINQTGFNPSRIQLVANTEARLVFDRMGDDFCQTIRIDEGLGVSDNRANILTGQRTDVEFTPERAGSFRMYCDDRPDLEATVTVQ